MLHEVIYCTDGTWGHVSANITTFPADSGSRVGPESGVGLSHHVTSLRTLAAPQRNHVVFLNE